MFLLIKQKPSCFISQSYGQHHGQCPIRSAPWPVPKTQVPEGFQREGADFFKKIVLIKVTFTNAGEMVQQFRVLDALAEDLHMLSHSCL